MTDLTTGARAVVALESDAGAASAVQRAVLDGLLAFNRERGAAPSPPA